MERRADPPDGPVGPARGNRFTRQNRLVKSWQYERVYREGRKKRGRHVVLHVAMAPGEPTRVGIVASRKVGGAVQRNRAKRQLRHVMRDLWPSIPGPGRQLVLIALSHIATVDFQSLEADVR